MKNIFTLLFCVIIISGCSSDSSNSEDDLGFDYFMRFEIPNNFNYEASLVSFDNYLNNDGSVDYSIDGYLERVGNNPLFQQDIVYFGINFTLNNEIQINQIIQIQNLSVGGGFPYTSDNFNFTQSCKLELEKQPSSTGFLKITQITDDYIKGEFEFYNLKNLGGTNPFTLEPCSNYPIQQDYDIVNGSFKALR